MTNETENKKANWHTVALVVCIIMLGQCLSKLGDIYDAIDVTRAAAGSAKIFAYEARELAGDAAREAQDCVKE